MLLLLNQLTYSFGKRRLEGAIVTLMALVNLPSQAGREAPISRGWRSKVEGYLKVYFEVIG